MKTSAKYTLWIAGVTVFHLLCARRIEWLVRSCGAPVDWVFFWKTFAVLMAITAFIVWDRWPRSERKSPPPEGPNQ